VQPTWTGSYHSTGWGHEMPWIWAPGTYRVECRTGDRLIATGSFEVTSQVATRSPATPTSPASIPASPFASSDRPSAQASAYETAISRADHLVKQGRYLEAFSAAKQALELDDSRFTAYYYAAFALFGQDLFDDALPYVKAALTRVPIQDQPAVGRLVVAIRQKHAFSEKVAAGDHALQQGQVAKAAASYTEAWQALPSRDDMALKAARLWIDRAREPVQGAKVLRELSDTAQDATVRDEAQRLLDQVRPAVQAIGEEALKWLSERAPDLIFYRHRKDFYAIEKCESLKFHGSIMYLRLTRTFEDSKHVNDYKVDLIDIDSALKASELGKDTWHITLHSKMEFRYQHTQVVEGFPDSTLKGSTKEISLIFHDLEAAKKVAKAFDYAINATRVSQTGRLF